LHLDTTVKGINIFYNVGSRFFPSLFFRPRYDRFTPWKPPHVFSRPSPEIMLPSRSSRVMCVAVSSLRLALLQMTTGSPPPRPPPIPRHAPSRAPKPVFSDQFSVSPASFPPNPKPLDPPLALHATSLQLPPQKQDPRPSCPNSDKVCLRVFFFSRSCPATAVPRISVLFSAKSSVFFFVPVPQALRSWAL